MGSILIHGMEHSATKNKLKNFTNKTKMKDLQLVTGVERKIYLDNPKCKRS